MSAQVVDDYVVQEHEFDDDDGDEDDFEDDDEALEHAAEMLRPYKATSSGYLLASGSWDGLVKLWDLFPSIAQLRRALPHHGSLTHSFCGR